ncbi:MAG TPA: hypothetical protein VL588_12295, partial [Bdellovibrionota bacterium]|nr:hypothetical protein [Bdellovibrionota bacterium]
MNFRRTILIASLLIPTPLMAADAGKQSAAPQDSDAVAVDSIKEKYWARGDQTEIGVVQNRMYSKTHKL